MTENTIESLAKRIKTLEEQVANHSFCHLDNHTDMRSLVTRVDEHQGEMYRVVREFIDSLPNEFEKNIQHARQKLEEIAAATRATLASSLTEATAQVKPEQIAEALAGAGRIIPVRPATRAEVQAGVAVPTRQVSRNELQ